MRTRITIGVAAVLLAFTLLIVGCEDSGVFAPTGTTITVTSVPATIIIDRTVGDTTGESEIIAQAFTDSNTPASGLTVTFETTAGVLSRVSGDPDAGVGLLETNSNGLARAYLTVSTIDDSPATVTVRSGTISGNVSVSRVIDTGNFQPEAVLTASPDGGQCPDDTVIFDGKDSFDRDGDAITCFFFTITASENLLESVATTSGELRRDFDDGLVLDVELAVSDDLTAGCCSPANNPTCQFSPVTDAINDYEISDLDPPVADAGANITDELPDGGGSVTVTLDGSDSTGSGLEYTWTCPGGTVSSGTSSNPIWECDYDTAGTYEATLSVTQQSCGGDDTDEDTVTITIEDAAP